jgi:fructose-1-phosphate kinase PfkB-like protein
LSAVYTWAIERKNSAVEALRWGVAAGTASARLPGMTFASLEQTREIFQQVELRRSEQGVTLP